MASPSKWQAFYEKAEGADAKAKSQAAWAAFARDASGTGPWKMSKFTPRERLELVKNDGYWDKARVPKVDRMLLLPMPEANARTAALLSGQVDWIEAPAPPFRRSSTRVRSSAMNRRMSGHGSSRVSRLAWNDIARQRPICIDREASGKACLRPVCGDGTFEVGILAGGNDLRDQV